MYAEHVLLAVLSPFPTLPSTFNYRIRNWSSVCWVGIIRDKLGYSKNSEAYKYFLGETLELTNACFACVRLIWRNCKTIQIIFKQHFFSKISRFLKISKHIADLRFVSTNCVEYQRLCYSRHILTRFSAIYHTQWQQQISRGSFLPHIFLEQRSFEICGRIF